MSNYNGWTNYATWRINLEIFDNTELGDFWGYHDAEEVEAYELGQTLQEYAEEILSEQSSGLALDYAMAFVSDVNWTEIAQSIIDNSKED
jgi:hypothetical protein